MDFYKIVQRSTRQGIDVFPDFRVGRSKDLMIRAKSFYAIWDDDEGLWSTDEYDVQRMVDKELRQTREKVGPMADVKWMSDFSTGSWKQFRSYMANVSDNSHQLDENLTFLNTEVKKSDYVSKRLPYPLEPGDTTAYEEIVSTLYDPLDRAKLEWAVGAIVAGDARNIQKFLVLYGPGGSGKSTYLNIIHKLFRDYCAMFDAKALTSSTNAFATEAFKDNPLVAIQHDGDLSKIEDNAKLNSIVSHEEILINEKYKPGYNARINAFLFMGTNKPVKITDAKSGIIRRLIDVNPSGRLIDENRYHVLMSQIDFELGAIAYHCLEVYRKSGRDAYAGYRPTEMILQTDVFYNFIEYGYETFKSQNGTNLVQAYEMYKTYCDEANIQFKLPRHIFREELRNYFQEFHARSINTDGVRVRSVYQGFISDKMMSKPAKAKAYSLVLENTVSLVDDALADCPAQYATDAGIPISKWANVTTKLSDLDTHRLHYVKPPENHIVIDFDLKDDNGDKSAEKNIEAASKWPTTYAEHSQSGSGIHLHYIYTGGDPKELSRVYSDGIEIKVFTGDASLRRRFSKTNGAPIAEIKMGLPTKDKKVLDFKGVQDENHLRKLVMQNLRKEVHPGTKPSIDFIRKLLDDAYTSGMRYDLTDLRSRILAFAANSTNQSDYCVRVVSEMKFHSEVNPLGENTTIPYKDEAPIVFYDVEVFPNLFLVSWKYAGAPGCTHMINPTPQEIGKLLQFRLVGFNNRRYDNHILYARFIGYSIEELYKISTKLVSNTKNGYFADAYNLSYTDIYDFASIKKSLKRWQLDLGIHHKELGLPWDEPVPEERWEEVASYCDNDVISTEAVWNDRQQDFVARQVLAELSGLTVNHTTQNHTGRIIFGNDRTPQDKFVYTDLSELFPGYEYDLGKSHYRGELVGEGGYVYAEPGMYENVAVLDVASMHPTSIEVLDLFGPYTKNYSELKQARIAIKHRDYEQAKKMLGGKLEKYLSDPKDADALSYALKIVINIVYGLTSAKFENLFKDPRNIDNIVAKRGALFMIDLKHAVKNKGWPVIHIKTDSIKIPGADQEIIDFVTDFGKLYGYDFEHEVTYEKMCLVNDAVYIAKIPGKEKAVGTDESGRVGARWSATGAQFAHPYVFKYLFSHEPIEFSDLCEIKTVTSSLHLAFDPDYEKNPPKFVGRAGSFCPILPGKGGGELLREKDGKYYAATGSKGYYWLEAEVVSELHKENDIDMSYFGKLVDSAVENLSKFGDVEAFLS